MEYKIKTDIFEGGRILQEVNMEHNDIVTKILRQVFDTTDKQAQEALVKLGWIRPEDKERIKRVLLRQIGNTRACPNCRYYFIPKDRTCEDALDIYRELFKNHKGGDITMMDEDRIEENTVDECTEIALKQRCDGLRYEILEIATAVKSLMKLSDFELIKEAYEGQHGEMKANIMLTYRHLEDARMRVGKILQAANDGVSILDKSEGKE